MMDLEELAFQRISEHGLTEIEKLVRYSPVSFYIEVLAARVATGRPLENDQHHIDLIVDAYESAVKKYLLINEVVSL